VKTIFSLTFLALFVFALVALPQQAQAADKDCEALMKQIDGLADKLAESSERLGKEEQMLETAEKEGHHEARNTLQNTIPINKSTNRENKVKIDNLLDKLCACCTKKAGNTAMAQGGDKECQALMKQINDLVDRLAESSERLGKEEQMLETAEKEGHHEARNTLQNTIPINKSTNRKNKVKIDNLLDKLCACCGKGEPSRPAQQPTPSTTDKVTNVLKTIGSSVNISIGGGHTSGHDEHHHGEDRHRTAEKVSTDKTKTHTTSPTTTRKTVTAGCKCHPCTCAPCTCH
jgi:hypothetical protein